MPSGLEQIAVKRRRDEDPVDGLYFPQKKLRPSAFWKRLPAEDLPNPAVSIHETTAESNGRAADVLNRNGVRGSNSNTLECPSIEKRQCIDDHPADKYPLSPWLTTRKWGDSLPRARESNERRSLRRFNLTKLTDPAHDQVFKGSATETDVPILLEEQGISPVDIPIPDADGLRQEESRRNQQALHQDTPHQRRPVVTPAEVERRVGSQHNSIRSGSNGSSRLTPNIHNLPRNWDQSEDLAADLQKIAEEEICLEASGGSASSFSSLKFRPKPPRPRRRDESQFAAAGESISIERCHSEFVYDIFVREHGPTPDMEGRSGGSSAQNVGIIIVDEGLETMWEACLEPQDSSSEWDSEEDDENAENYYGNDYPDEEAHSGDEHDWLTYEDDSKFHEGDYISN